jgi:hypothetical protein
MRNAMLCLSFMLLLGQGPTKEPWTYRSFTSDFKRVADSTSGLPMAERVTMFRSTFDKLYPGLYADVDQPQLDGRIEKALSEFPSIRSKYDQVERKFPEALASAMKEFRVAFPDFTPPMPIYLIHSLGTRDGGTDWVAGRMVMLFGADEIAQFHWDESLQPFIVHELFHIEHIRHFADCDQLWCSLWQEGLATYTASVLSPNASDHQLILDVPHPIREDTDSHWPDALCWTAEHFDSKNPSEVSAAFTGGPKPSAFSEDLRLAPLPSRFGYYIGFRVATQAVKNRSLSELDRLGDQAARPIVARALAELMQASHLSCPLPAKQGSITHHAPRSP